MSATAGYSAKVVLTLLVGDKKLRLSHVGPSHFMIRGECDPMPPCDATLIIRVDDSEEICPIFLPHGIPGPRQPVTFY